VKKVAKSLLDKLKREMLVLGWRKHQTSRARLVITINELMKKLPRTYTKELYQSKCDAVYQHFYESYLGEGKSVYAGN